MTAVGWAGGRTRSGTHLLVVEFLGLARFEELQQVPERSLIVVSERIPWTVPVPGHHTTRQGGKDNEGVGVTMGGWRRRPKRRSG